MERSQHSRTTDGADRHDDGPGARASTPGRQTRTQAPEPASTVQRLAAADPAPGQDDGAAQRIAATGIAGAGGALPHGDRIQRLFGPAHDVSAITAHVGGPAAAASAQLGARAYATGAHVAFADAPDLHTAAHEAAHVVQQRAGVQLAGNVGQAGDAYEQHADAVADHVVRGESAAALLDAGAAPRGSATTAAAVQRAPAGAKGGPTKLVDDLTAAIAAGEWEAIRKRVYPREAAAARARANKRRAGKAPDLAGLGAVTSIDSIAAAIKALQGSWATKTWVERGDAMVRAANAALTAAQVPSYLDHEIMSMTARGSFDRSLWKFNIRKEAVTAPPPTNDEAGQIANTVAHESRHAEQHFLRGRYLAGTGMAAPEVATATGMPPSIAAQAVTHKLGAKDPRVAEAKKMDRAFGADGAKHRKTSNQVDTEIALLNTRRSAAIAAHAALQASPTPAAIADGKRRLAALKAQTLQVEKAYLAYRAIPYEADAHEVGDSTAEAYAKLP